MRFKLPAVFFSLQFGRLQKILKETQIIILINHLIIRECGRTLYVGMVQEAVIYRDVASGIDKQS